MIVRLQFSLTKDGTVVYPDDHSVILPSPYAAAFQSILTNLIEDKALAALLLDLPTEETLLQESSIPCDPLIVYAARRCVKEKIRRTFANELTHLYDTLTKECEGVPYRITPEDVGRRSLRNLCLSYLAAPHMPSPSPPSRKLLCDNRARLAFDHFKTSTNMTDKLAGKLQQLECATGGA